MATTREQLSRLPFWEIRISEIVVACGVTKQTFYNHFGDVVEVILALTERISLSKPSVIKPFAEDWARESAIAQAARFIKAYRAEWAKEYATLEAATTIASHGDHRFLAARVRSVTPLIEAMTCRILRIREGLSQQQVAPEAARRAAVMTLIAVESWTALRLRDTPYFAGPELYERELAEFVVDKFYSASFMENIGEN